MNKQKVVIDKDTPRIIVEFLGVDRFRWGMVGSMPIMPLLGYVARVQSELMYRHPDNCPEMVLVIAWDKDTAQFHWCVHPDIPVDPLLGTLELVKASLIGMYVANAAQQAPILGPNGLPIRR